MFYFVIYGAVLCLLVLGSSRKCREGMYIQESGVGPGIQSRGGAVLDFLFEVDAFQLQSPNESINIPYCSVFEYIAVYRVRDSFA